MDPGQGVSRASIPPRAELTPAQLPFEQIGAADLLEILADAVYAIDREWRFIYVNAAGETFTRRPRGELLGTTVWNAFADVLGTAVETALRNAMELGAAAQIDDFYIRQLDVWTSLRVSPSPSGITLCLRDVSAEKRSESARWESEARWRALIENASDPISILGADGSVRYGSPAFRRLLGYEPGELLNTASLRLIHPDDEANVRLVFRRLLESPGASEQIEMRHRRKDGSFIVLAITFRNLLHEPAVRGIVCNGYNVTEQRRLEERLGASERRLRAMFEASPVPTYAWQRDGGDFRLVDFNEAAARATHGAIHQRIGDALSEYYADNAFMIERIHAAADDRTRPHREEIDYVFRSTREQRRVAMTFVGAAPDLVLVHAEDLTDRRAAETALRDREEQLAAIVSIQQEVATARMDLEYVMQLVVDRALALTGADGVAVELIENEELVHRAVTGSATAYSGLRLKISASLSGLCVRSGELVQCDDTETDPRVDRDACRRIGARSMIMMPLLHEGTAIGALRLLAGTPHRFGARDERTLRLLAGSLGAAIGRAMDFRVKEALSAERAAALETLQAREAHFRSLIENASDPILLVSAVGRRIYASPAFSRVMGYAGTDDERDPMGSLHPDDVARAQELLGRLVATPDGTVSADVRIRHANGSYRTITCTGRNLLAHPSVGALVVNLRDITDQKALEEQLRQSQKMEAVGQLAGGVAHDFNNLLTVIQVSSDFLLNRLGPDGAGRADALEIGRSAQRAAALTRQLLAFSRQQVLTPRDLDLNATVSDVSRMLGRLIGDDIELVIDLHNDIGRVMADPGQIEQVMVNLAVNARDAMSSGGRLRIATSNADIAGGSAAGRDSVPPGAYVLLTVSDTGDGMDSATVERIFEPFFTTKAIGKGTGLGLATVYGIVRQSGGFIRVSSERGRGSLFEVYLPRIAGTGHSEPDSAAMSADGGAETLLLVEDADAVRLVGRKILESLGYTVLEAANGRAALALAADFPGAIDALVTDVVMPEMGGRELAGALRATRPEARVLYMSGYTDDDIIRRGILESGSMFLEKPFSAESLGDAVRQVLNLRAHQA